MTHTLARPPARIVILGAFAIVCGLLAAVLPAAPSAAALRPLLLELSATEGSAGSDISVSGEGFRGRVPGTLTWAETVVATFTTDVHGRFSLTTPVPIAPTGPLTVTATADKRTVSTDFTTFVEPAPAATETETEIAICDMPQMLPPLTWAPPSTDGYTSVVIDAPGTYDLRSDVDYVVSSPSRIDGAVHLRGGRNVVWTGGHIRIPDLGAGPVSSAARRGLVISDHDDRRGNPGTYGYSREGRVVHVEGLLIDGPDLAEGINTNAPTAVVQLQNVRVEGVHFKSSDDRDGTAGWGKNHPDILQTWGSQAELRVDGLSGTSAYQGIFLKEDAPDSVRGPVWLRRIDVGAVKSTGTDGTAYAGHRMLSWYGESTGTIRLDSGTVRVNHHANSGWNRAKSNPDPTTAFWRGRYLSAEQGRYVSEPPPGDAAFTDALGNTVPERTGTDADGTFAQWSGHVLDWSGTAPGRVYSGSPSEGQYVPAGSSGLDYASPGYQSSP